MKILHTSDWHLGHTLYNYDRTEEQLSMLKQIEDIVREHQPDVFLLCGDVYHTYQPSSAVQTMLSEAIINIRNANPNMTMIITAGNHDSAAKHEIFTTPWKALKVHTIGNLDKNNINKHIIKIDNIGYIIAILFGWGSFILSFFLGSYGFVGFIGLFFPGFMLNSKDSNIRKHAYIQLAIMLIGIICTVMFLFRWF